MPFPTLFSVFFITSIATFFALSTGRSCACPEIFAPVCCRTPSGAVETKSNDCFCTCEKGSVLFQDQCRDPADCPCPALFAPVCCKLPDGTLNTEGNSCNCGCKNGVVTKATGGCVNPAACSCLAIVDPVCCRLPSGMLSTEGNSCECGCKNGSVQSNQECLPSVSPTPSTVATKVCRCSKERRPVCCRLSTGNFVVKANSCLCNCETGSKIVPDLKCKPPVCVCTKERKPVCCRLPNGKLETKSNPCLCTKKGCANGKVIYNKQCTARNTCLNRCSKKRAKTVCCVSSYGVFRSRNTCACKRCQKGVSIKRDTCPVCVCTREFDPVRCRVKKMVTVTRANPCLCRCIGGTVLGSASR